MQRDAHGRITTANGPTTALPASLLREIEAMPFRTIAQTAALLGGTRRWVQGQIALGRMTVHRYGRRMVRIAAGDLATFVARHRQ